MSKPHEETWTAGGQTISVDGEISIISHSAATASAETASGRAQLAAQAPAMARLLLDLRALHNGEVAPSMPDILDRAYELLSAAGVLP